MIGCVRGGELASGFGLIGLRIGLGPASFLPVVDCDLQPKLALLTRRNSARYKVRAGAIR